MFATKPTHQPLIRITALKRGSSLRVNSAHERKQLSSQVLPPSSSLPVPAPSALALAVFSAALLTGLPAEAALHAEPSNALSLPTWAIHVSSVAEWVTAMFLFWRYAAVSNNPLWRLMTYGMIPSLGGAMSACTWHFFYNSPELEFLVVLQSGLTVVGNATCWYAAYRIWEGAQGEKGGADSGKA